MFSLTISFGPATAVWVLMYNDQAKAESAFSYCYRDSENLNDQIRLSDDFGQIALISRHSIHGVMLEDMEKSKLAHIERALHQARLQAKAQEMAENDSQLRAARARSGPAIIDPMGRPAGNGLSPFR